MDTNPPSDTVTNYFIRVIDADHFSIHPTEYSSTVSGANPFTVSGNQSPPFGVVHNTATVTKTSHGYSTGNAVTFMTTAATSPNVSLNTSTNYFVRKLDDNNFTLHATSNDAASNANAITLDATAATFSLNRFGNTTAFSAGSFVTQNVLLNSTFSSAEATAYAAGSYTSSDVFANGLTAEQAKSYATGSFVSTDPFGNGDFSEVQRTALNAGSFVTVNPIDSAEDTNAKLYESGAKFSSAIDLTGFATSLGSVRLTDIENAKSALDMVNATVERITMDRASLGAILSRMQYTSDQITEHKMNLSAAISRISDVDIAEEATNYARQQILVQSGTQMLGQANDLPRTILELLRR
jgi:flagellin